MLHKLLFLVIGGSDEGPIQIWNQTSGSVVKTLVGHSDSVRALKMITKDVLASGSSDELIKLWNITSGVLLKNLTFHTSKINALETFTSKLNKKKINTKKLI